MYSYVGSFKKNISRYISHSISIPSYICIAADKNERRLCVRLHSTFLPPFILLWFLAKNSKITLWKIITFSDNKRMHDANLVQSWKSWKEILWANHLFCGLFQPLFLNTSLLEIYCHLCQPTSSVTIFIMFYGVLRSILSRIFIKHQ